MPVIKVWCLPKLSEKKLQTIFKSIVSVVEGIEELGLKGEQSMKILFPTDAMKYGLGTKIIIEVTGLFKKPKRTKKVLARLAKGLGTALHRVFPKALVECSVHPFNPKQGFWISR